MWLQKTGGKNCSQEQPGPGGPSRPGRAGHLKPMALQVPCCLHSGRAVPQVCSHTCPHVSPTRSVPGCLWEEGGPRGDRKILYLLRRNNRSLISSRL